MRSRPACSGRSLPPETTKTRPNSNSKGPAIRKKRPGVHHQLSDRPCPAQTRPAFGEESELSVVAEAKAYLLGLEDQDSHIQPCESRIPPDSAVGDKPALTRNERRRKNRNAF